MTWDFFERRICLTTLDDEWRQGLIEFDRVGLQVEKFQSVSDIGPHQSFNHSTNSILRNFFESGAATLLFLEDDCVFRPLDHLERALSELPPAWDIVYLGANLTQHESNVRKAPTRHSSHLFRIYHAWTTHCVGYNRNVIPWILQNQPEYSAEMYDCWLAREFRHLNVFCVAPMVAYQRPRVSSIWQKGVVDDYTPIFEASEGKLR